MKVGETDICGMASILITLFIYICGMVSIFIILSFSFIFSTSGKVTLTISFSLSLDFSSHYFTLIFNHSHFRILSVPTILLSTSRFIFAHYFVILLELKFDIVRQFLRNFSKFVFWWPNLELFRKSKMES